MVPMAVNCARLEKEQRSNAVRGRDPKKALSIEPTGSLSAIGMLGYALSRESTISDYRSASCVSVGLGGLGLGKKDTNISYHR